jgi:hypothetical protein
MQAMSALIVFLSMGNTPPKTFSKGWQQQACQRLKWMKKQQKRWHTPCKTQFRRGFGPKNLSGSGQFHMKCQETDDRSA